MKENCDKADAEYEAKLKERNEELAKKSDFDKLMEYNTPKWIIPIGVLSSFVSGLMNPYCGIVFARILGLLTVPEPALKYLDPEGKGGYPYMK